MQSMTSGTASSFMRPNLQHLLIPNQLARIPTHRWEARKPGYGSSQPIDNLQA